MAPFAAQLAAQVGAQVASNAGNNLMNRLFAKHDRKINWKESGRYLQRNLTAEKNMAQYNKGISLELAAKNQEYAKDYFNYTSDYMSAENEKKRLIEAGLNPGLMYSGGAGTQGGLTGGAAAQTPSADAPNEQYRPMGLSDMQGLALRETAAERQLKLAEARKLNADADVVESTGKKEAQSRISKLIAETNSETTKQKLINLESDIAEIEKANRQYKLTSEIQNTLQNARRLELENSITTDEYSSILKEIHERAIGQALNNSLTEIEIESKRHQIKLTDTQRQQILTSIQQKWMELGLSERSVSVSEYGNLIKKFEAEIQAEYPNMWSWIGSVLKKAYDNIEQIDKVIRREDTADRVDKTR